MKRMLLRMLFLLGGLIVGLFAGLLLPTEQRLKLSQPLPGMIGRMVEQMPEG